VGVALVVASLVLLDWVGGPGNGRLIDLKRSLDDVGSGAPDEIDRLAGYTAWMPWVLGAICAATAVAAVLSRKRMKTVTRVVAMVVLVQSFVLPVFMFMFMGSATTAEDTPVANDDHGADVATALVVVVGGIAVALALSYVPAHIAAVLAAVIGSIGQLVAWSDLSEIEAEIQLGVPAVLAGYALLAVAAMAGRGRQPQQPPGMPPPGMPGMPYRV
jgi:hypothetical protein